MLTDQSAGVIVDLADLAAAFDPEMDCLTAAQRHLRDLDQLVADMAANMRNAGQAYTPPPPAPPKLPAESVYCTPRKPEPAVPRPSVGDWRRTSPKEMMTPLKPAAVADAPAKITPGSTVHTAPAPAPVVADSSGAPAGTLTTADTLARLGFSLCRLYQLQADPAQLAPRPVGRHGRSMIYSIADIDAFLARRAAAKTTKAARKATHGAFAR